MNPFTILPPELHMLVARHFDHKTFAECSRVSRSWYQQFLPSVWETVTIKTSTQLEAFKASVDSGALSRHCHLISTLRTQSYEVIEMLIANGAATCTNLTQLHVAFRCLRKGSANGPKYIRALPLVCLLESNPGLKSVTLHGCLIKWQMTLSQILTALPVGVEHLRLDGNTRWPGNERGNTSPGVSEQDASTTSATENGRKSDLPTLALRKIELVGEVEGEQSVFETLKRSPLLESLVFDDAMHFMYTGEEVGLSGVLRDHCPALTSLYMDPGFVDDGFISQLVDEASIKGWKHLTFFGEGFGPLTEAAIMKHAGSIESLHMTIGLGFGSSAIQRLFCSAPNLKSFRGVRQSCIYADVQLEASDMVQSPWVCHSLEELELCISGIPRPDLTKRTNGRPLTGPLHEDISTETSYKLQRQVYAQLGKLTKLRELVLSVSLEMMRRQYPADLSDYEWETEGMYYNGELQQAGRQYECLSFTLESGLDLLRDLKELRVIDLNDMAVGIDGEAEQRWVKRHWPLVKQT